MTPRAFTGLLDAVPSRSLLEVYAALRDMPTTLRSRTLDAATKELSAGWREEIAARPGYNAAQRAIVAANPTATAHLLGLTVATGGTGDLAELTREYEFGTLDQDEFNTYTRRGPSGTLHIVKRRTKKQIPPRSQTGWIAYPAAKRWSARVFRMFQQIIVKSAHDSIDGGR